MEFDYVIVGAGLSGLTIAERIANELDEKVLIIEKRDHIGGNVYDFYDDGLLIQKYGPHTYPSLLNGLITNTGCSAMLTASLL